MLPPSPASSMRRATAWIAKKIPRKFTSTISSHISSVRSSGRTK